MELWHRCYITDSDIITQRTLDDTNIHRQKTVVMVYLANNKKQGQ